MNIRQITSLLEFCLRSTYFTFQNKYYEQIEGTAMGSPISPIVAKLYMEDLETKAIQQLHIPLHSGRGLWMIPLLSSRHPTNRSF